MRCPHCGKYGGWCSTRYHDEEHPNFPDNCYSYVPKCVREKWRCPDGHEWTQWTCEK